MQLCHPDLRNEFPPLRVRSVVASHNLPAQFTSFVGRQAEMAALHQLVTGNRLVTLTGAGGAGKTRLAAEVAGQLTDDFSDGLWFVDLAPINNSLVVPVTVARTLGLPDQPGRSTMDLLLAFFGDKKMLLVFDNCEHLLDACGTLVVDLLAASPNLTILTTSREPLGLPGELSWRVPSLPLADEAVELFADRARRVRPDFVVDEGNSQLIKEICERLDGMPLAIELAAARVRALSLRQILDSLHDRFRLLTGGARTAVRRQQTLRASVDWSHALLTEPERVLFRRLAVFAGGFDLDAAQAVGADNEAELYQLVDQLSLLVDKSLVVASDTATGMRYRMLETVRQYAQEKLGESGEADKVRNRHRDYYTATAVDMQSQGARLDDDLLQWAGTEIENLRAAFGWSRENADPETALRLLSSLQRFWIRSGRLREALAGFDQVFNQVGQSEIEPAVWVRAVADHALLAAWAALPTDLGRAREALAQARQLQDPALITHVLTGCGAAALDSAELGHAYLAEAIELARARDDLWSLSQIFAYQAAMLVYAGEPGAARAAAEEGANLAEALGDRFTASGCRVWLGAALGISGDFPAAVEVLRALVAEAQAAQDLTLTVFAQLTYANVLSFQGNGVAAGAAAESALAAAEVIGGFYGDAVYGVLANAALAAGDTVAATEAAEECRRRTVPVREFFIRTVNPMAEAALASGDLVAARSWADESVAMALGGHRAIALTVRAWIATAQNQPDQAERDAHEALTIAARTRTYFRVPDALELLARLAVDDGSQSYAARLLGAAHGIRQRTQQGRLPLYQEGYDAVIANAREALGNNDF